MTERMECDIIAEVGWNHMGNMDLATEMIESAARYGADIVKFQTWQVKNLKPGPWDNDGRRQIYEKAELLPLEHTQLSKICENEGVQYLTSVFNIEDLKWVRNITNSVKIPSHEATNIPLVSKAFELFDHVWLSCGATTFGERELLVDAWDLHPDCHVTPMHCVSSYPLMPDKAQLHRIGQLSDQFDARWVGYSSHTEGISDAIAAIAMFPQLIAVEKHFTINKDLPGRDNKFAILPEELYQLAIFTRDIRHMCADHGLDYLTEEQEIRDVYKGRWG